MQQGFMVLALLPKGDYFPSVPRDVCSLSSVG